jgi:hypothetical protein
MIVCSKGVVGWYGANVTPWIFYENFIDVMVNIDGIDRARGMPLVGVMMECRAGEGSVAGRRLHCESTVMRDNAIIIDTHRRYSEPDSLY